MDVSDGGVALSPFFLVKTSEIDNNVDFFN